MNQREKLLQQALYAFETHDYNGIALLPTGSGKGRLMIEIAKRLKSKRILYLCDSEELRDKMFLDELHKWDATHLIPNIEMVCYQTAYKWKDKEYDLVLADEFDAALTPKYIDVFLNNKFKHKICVSATLDDHKRVMAKKIGKIILEKKQKELIEDKVLNNIQFYFINYDLTAKDNESYLQFNKRFIELLNQPQTQGVKRSLESLQIKRKQFLSSLASNVDVTKWLLSTLESRNEKVLIFCGLSDQADKVCSHSYHSNNNNINALRNFEAGITKQLSVVEKVTRGVNIDEVRNIILESVGRSKTKMTQKIGRGLRLSADQVLNVFFIVPFYKHPFYGRKATVVQEWILFSTKDMNLSNAITINYHTKRTSNGVGS